MSTTFTQIIFVTGGFALAVNLIVFLTYIPRCLRSIFRYQLWQIRDEAYDSVRTGALPDADCVKLLIRDAERLIEGAADVTPLCAVLLARTFRNDSGRIASRERREKMLSTREQLADAERVIYDQLEGRLQASFGRQFLFGSPVGWLVVPVVSLIGIFLMSTVGVAQTVARLVINCLPLDDNDEMPQDGKLSWCV